MYNATRSFSGLTPATIALLGAFAMAVATLAACETSIVDDFAPEGPSVDAGSASGEGRSWTLALAGKPSIGFSAPLFLENGELGLLSSPDGSIIELIKVDTVTRAVTWRHNIAGDGRLRPADEVHRAGGVIVVQGDERARAYDLNSGRSTWALKDVHSFGRGSATALPIVRQGRGHRFYCQLIDLTDGSTRGEYAFPEGAGGGPRSVILIEEGGQRSLFYVRDSETQTTFVLVDIARGAERWSVAYPKAAGTVQAYFETLPHYRDGVVLLVGGGVAYGVDVVSGALRYASTLPSGINVPSRYREVEIDTTTGIAVLAETRFNVVLGLDIVSGSLRWSRSRAGATVDLSILGGGVALRTDNCGQVEFFNTSDGTVRELPDARSDAHTFGELGAYSPAAQTMYTFDGSTVRAFPLPGAALGADGF